MDCSITDRQAYDQELFPEDDQRILKARQKRPIRHRHHGPAANRHRRWMMAGITLYLNNGSIQSGIRPFPRLPIPQRGS
jgi:hypothetical protein